MKKIIVFLFSINAFSQVEIGTTTPQKTLDVNGSLQITKELLLGGNATTSGSPGAEDNILTSGGEKVAPYWKNWSTILPGTKVPVIYISNDNIYENHYVPAMVPDQDELVVLDNLSEKDPRMPRSTGQKKLNFKTPALNTEYVTYNPAESTFTIKKAGYYIFSMYFRFNVKKDEFPDVTRPKYTQANNEFALGHKIGMFLHNKNSYPDPNYDETTNYVVFSFNPGVFWGDRSYYKYHEATYNEAPILPLRADKPLYHNGTWNQVGQFDEGKVIDFRHSFVQPDRIPMFYTLEHATLTIYYVAM